MYNSHKRERVHGVNNLDIIMPMYNLVEYSYNYSDTSESLWQFKRDESPVTEARNPDNVSVDNTTSFKYKSMFLNYQLLLIMEYLKT